MLAVTGSAGSGKTFAMTHYTEKNKRVYMLGCSEFWNRKQFLAELLLAMGKDYSGYTIQEMMHEAVKQLKTTDRPLLILDEADKLSNQVFFFFITLYNKLENECGIALCATNHLEKRLREGIKFNRKGYNEIWSRIGRKCIELKGVGAADIAAICEVNGITQKNEIEKVINDSESDLRRVRRKVHAIKKAARVKGKDE